MKKNHCKIHVCENRFPIPPSRNSHHHNTNTNFPTTLPCHTLSTASSALSKGCTESIISSNRIPVAESAAQRSSMSIFEPALIPLCLMSVSLWQNKSRPVAHSPQTNPPINNQRHQLLRILETRLTQIPNLANRASAARTLQALQQRARAADFDHEIYANTVCKP
jgi:hypothetical protein